ncbi:hypothetical protein F2Q70_00001531 [Brassica cretica]|uniref:Secreted protein n=1 Tax=Brassica cretica TaxID=69181 RepID=A0A8S9IPA8_BRACR|nr:hypothetical protein F2Q70_00001531 [Brassica cretica]KAF3567273.1 hypothetical protein DY000_02012527 [Brassica cretica]
MASGAVAVLVSLTACLGLQVRKCGVYSLNLPGSAFCTVWAVLSKSSTSCSRLSFIFKNISSGRPKLPDSGSQINCGSSFCGKRGADLVELLDRGFSL